MADPAPPAATTGAARLLSSMGGLHAASHTAAAKQASAAAKQGDDISRLRRRVEASAERLAAVGADERRRDWTATYRAWDEWEDPEMVAELERAARAKVESASKRAAFAGCSHDHSAERAVCVQRGRVCSVGGVWGGCAVCSGRAGGRECSVGEVWVCNVLAVGGLQCCGRVRAVGVQCQWRVA